MGWLGYEAGAWFEQMPSPVSAPSLPQAWWGTISCWARFDRLGRRVAGNAPVASSPSNGPRAPGGRLVERPSPRTFTGGVRAVLDHLRRGDAYQVNLSRRLVVATPGDPLDAWLRLRALNPARRAILVETPVGAVVSNSPELLLRQRGRKLLSVPIKGTAPAGAARAALLESPKERAELTMIVDLVRADLGRVAAPGTVRAGPRRVGRVGHLWHAMQRVHAELDEGRDTIDAISALFPPGSVTGAPKVRAMEIIRALEPVPRGVYSGGVGWIGPGGCELNVAIRTIQFAGGEAHVHVGAGIVLGSEPERELLETDLKAERLLQALLA
ncbi:MAG: anthranilate synthase component I family protein [Deltaproteobacteria bacterium]|nr:anthranilate synthase component I family protein [Deltaproteobacteria bacterium]